MHIEPEQRRPLRVLEGKYRIGETGKILYVVSYPRERELDVGGTFEREKDGTRWRVEGIEMFRHSPRPPGEWAVILAPMNSNDELYEGDTLIEVPA